MRQGSGKPVEDEAALGVGLGQAVPDDVDHQLVRDELAAVEIGAGSLTLRGPGVDLGAQDIASGDRRNPVLLRQPGGLGALARSGRAEQDEIQRHGYLQRKPMGSA